MRCQRFYKITKHTSVETAIVCTPRRSNTDWKLIPICSPSHNFWGCTTPGIWFLTKLKLSECLPLNPQFLDDLSPMGKTGAWSSLSCKCPGSRRGNKAYSTKDLRYFLSKKTKWEKKECRCQIPLLFLFVQHSDFGLREIILLLYSTENYFSLLLNQSVLQKTFKFIIALHHDSALCTFESMVQSLSLFEILAAVHCSVAIDSCSVSASFFTLLFTSYIFSLPKLSQKFWNVREKLSERTFKN